jgi:hypothetical protein
MIHRKFTLHNGAERTLRACRAPGQEHTPPPEVPSHVPPAAGNAATPENEPQVVSLEHSGYSTKPEASVFGHEQQFALKPNNNLREDASSRISERHLIQQTNQNPFYANTSYLNDLAAQEKYLRPANSSYQK